MSNIYLMRNTTPRFKRLKAVRSIFAILAAALCCAFLVSCSSESPSQATSQVSAATKAQESNAAPPNDHKAESDNKAESHHKADRKKSYRLVMLGDSITAGFGLAGEEALPVKLESALRDDGHNITIINAGVSGDTTRDALNRFDWSVDNEADAILIALGGNDLLQGVDPVKIKDNLSGIIEDAQARGLMTLMAGMRAPGNYGVQYQQNFDQLYIDLSKQYNVPLYPFLLEKVAARPDLNQSDGIHPNTKGVKIIVSQLAPFIEEHYLP